MYFSTNYFLTSFGCSQGFQHFAGFPTGFANDIVVDEDDVSHLDAPHQHQRGGGGEEFPVDEAGDEEKTHRHSAGNPTTPSVAENEI